MKSSITSWQIRVGLVLLLGMASGCGKKEPLSADGFVLPKGDVSAGQAAFVELGCRQCHSVAKLDLPPYDGVSSLDIELGGKMARIKDYGELLTSVVNPNHVISKDYQRLLNKEEAERGASPMPDFKNRITVGQLINLVEFLHSRYEELVPEYRGYSYTYAP